MGVEGHFRVGMMRHRLGDLHKADAAYTAALAIYNQLAASSPITPICGTRWPALRQSGDSVHPAARIRQGEAALARGSDAPLGRSRTASRRLSPPSPRSVSTTSSAVRGTGFQIVHVHREAFAAFDAEGEGQLIH